MCSNINRMVRKTQIESAYNDDVEDNVGIKNEVDEAIINKVEQV